MLQKMRRVTPSVALAAKANRATPLGFITEILQLRPKRYAAEVLRPLLERWGSLFLDRAGGAVMGTARTIGTRPDGAPLVTDVATVGDQVVVDRAFADEWIEAMRYLGEVAESCGGLCYLFFGPPPIGSRVWRDDWHRLLDGECVGLCPVLDSVGHSAAPKPGTTNQAELLAAWLNNRVGAWGVEPVGRIEQATARWFKPIRPDVCVMTAERYRTITREVTGWWTPHALADKLAVLVMVDGAAESDGSKRADLARDIVAEQSGVANFGVLLAVRGVSLPKLDQIRAMYN